jgi:hypothetical protein
MEVKHHTWVDSYCLMAVEFVWGSEGEISNTFDMA